MLYLIIKWIHILSATVLVGVGFGTAFYKWMADRSGDIRTIANVSHFVVIADWVFTTPAIVIQPLTGITLAHLAGFPIDRGWVAVSILLYVLAGACWVPVVFLQYRMRWLSRQALAAGTALPKEYSRCALIWFWLGTPAFLAMVAVYGLMVLKP